MCCVGGHSHLHVLDGGEDGAHLAAARHVRVAAALALAVQAREAVHVAGAPLAAAGQLARTQGRVPAPAARLLGLGLGWAAGAGAGARGRHLAGPGRRRGRGGGAGTSGSSLLYCLNNSDRDSLVRGLQTITHLTYFKHALNY